VIGLVFSFNVFPNRYAIKTHHPLREEKKNKTGYERRFDSVANRFHILPPYYTTRIQVV